MALSFPYPLSFLSDVLRRVDVTFDLQRNDELSGSGDSRYWTSELARPLWTVSVSMSAHKPADARAVDARIRALAGAKGSFLFADPLYAPAAGGVPGSAVTVRAISTERDMIGLAGLPEGYRVEIGDRFSIASAAGAIYFGEFAEAAVATSAGITAQLTVTPYPPLWLGAGASVELAMPYLKAFIPPGGHTPFTTHPGYYADNASLSMVQRP
ncbi:hypothetical protein [Paenirhodobacter enshiensis]|uniref:hypothetical protein n=1 Tax=Paenirhodobacter enshiensis TaxID=1105367 RepID=UPI00056875D4|nr:hypothetical protein [Paenirhodobacter enshiensis]